MNDKYNIINFQFAWEQFSFAVGTTEPVLICKQSRVLVMAELMQCNVNKITQASKQVWYFTHIHCVPTAPHLLETRNVVICKWSSLSMRTGFQLGARMAFTHSFVHSKSRMLNEWTVQCNTIFPLSWKICLSYYIITLYYGWWIGTRLTFKTQPPTRADTCQSLFGYVL